MQFPLTSTRGYIEGVVCSPIGVYATRFCEGRFRDHVHLYNEVKVTIRYDMKCQCLKLNLRTQILHNCFNNHELERFAYLLFSRAPSA